LALATARGARDSFFEVEALFIVGGAGKKGRGVHSQCNFAWTWHVQFPSCFVVVCVPGSTCCRGGRLRWLLKISAQQAAQTMAPPMK
jgi:hypothetical protein